MNESTARRVSHFDLDLKWLLGLLTLVAVVMYGVVLFTVPEIRPLPVLVIFTLLLAFHLFLHWQLLKIASDSTWLHIYVLVQGLLFFAIGWLTGNPNMIFPLFAGLVGETIGTFGPKRRGILVVCFYIALLAVIFLIRFDLAASGWLIVGTLAIVTSTVLYTLLYKRQVDARARAQSLLAELESANRQLREYAARVEELTSAAERQRMARELHDTLSQGLAGLILQLEAVEAHLSGSCPERALEIVQQAKGQARETLIESRQAIADLRKTGIRDLREATLQEAEHFSASTGIPVEVEIILPANLPEALSEATLRVVSEGLTNIARHAQAGNVKLRIDTSLDSKEIQIELVDDGIGFDPSAVEAGHYGLLGMRERIRLAGGNLAVTSKPGKGTQIMIRFPLENAGNA